MCIHYVLHMLVSRDQPAPTPPQAAPWHVTIVGGQAFWFGDDKRL